MNYGRAGLAAALTVGFGLSVLLSLMENRLAGQGVSLWTANGFLAGAFILLPGRWRTATAVACLGLQAAISLALGHNWAAALVYPAVNLVEAGLTAWLAVTYCGARNRRLSLQELMMVPLGAIVPAAMVGGLLGAAASTLAAGRDFTEAWLDWAIPGGLGMAIVLPAVLLVPRIGQYREFNRNPWEAGALFAVLGGLATSVFLERGLPLEFLIFPALTLVGMRLGPPGAAVAGFVVAMIGLPLVMMGVGSVVSASPLTLQVQLRITELIVVAGLFTALVAGGAVAEEARLRRLLIGRDRVARAARLRARRAERAAAEAQAQAAEAIRLRRERTAKAA